MPFNRYESALSVISDTMSQLGLRTPTTVVGNTDKTVAQFLSLANNFGQELVADEFKWQVLDREYTVTTVIGQANYALPEDYDGFVSDASWNRSTRLPVLGSLTKQEWQMLKARLLTGTTFTALFRITEDEILFYDTPTETQTIVFPYTSRGWVRNAADTQRQDTILADTDVILFDPYFFKTGLKKKWREEKEFDTTKIDYVYNRARAAAMANDRPGRTLSLVGSPGFPYLNGLNIPDTGYGP